MTETTTEYAVKNLRTNEFCVPSTDGSDCIGLKVTGDLFGTLDDARQYIRNETGKEPAESHLQVQAVEPATNQ